MSKVKDFFFGEYNVDKNESCIALRDLDLLIKKTSPEFFTSQLNRILEKHNNHLTLSNGTSSPPFYQLIDNIISESIGYIEIYARTDINKHLGVTLACDIILEKGVISVVPHWTAYKDMRAGEIVSTLLVPLYLSGLCDKTYIRWANDKLESLSNKMDCRLVLNKIFTLAEHPHASFIDKENAQFDREVLELVWAGRVADEKLRGNAAAEALNRLREEYFRTNT